MLQTNSYNVGLSGDGISLPDLELPSIPNYNTPPETGGTDWVGGIQTAVDVFGRAAGAAGQVVAIVDRARGTNVATPVTLPAPDSPIGNNDTNPERVGIFASWPVRIASKLGVGVGVVWAGIALVGAFVVWAVYRIIRRFI